MKAVFVALAVLCLAHAVRAEPPSAGRALFDGLSGAPGQALIGNTPTEATRFACRNCHGRDGAGGTEGDVPPITWDVLARPAANRPQYDARAFARLLSSGEDPAGRALSRQMPRYRLDDPTVSSLIQHLSTLPSLERRGILPDRIVLAVPIPPDNAARATQIAEALSRAAEAVPEAGIFGRRLEIRSIAGGPDTMIPTIANEAAAMVGLVPSDRISLTVASGAGLPVLFPLPALSGAEDPTVLRSLAATEAEVIQALAARALDDGDGPVAVLPAGDPALTGALLARLGGRALPVAPGGRVTTAAGAVLAAELTSDDLARLPSGIPLYAPLEAVAQHRPALQARGVPVVAGFGGGALLRAGAVHPGSAEEVYAGLVVQILTRALAEGGRDLTRTGLLRALGRADLADLGLDFADGRLSGQPGIVFFKD